MLIPIRLYLLFRGLKNVRMFVIRQVNIVATHICGPGSASELAMCSLLLALYDFF